MSATVAAARVVQCSAPMAGAVELVLHHPEAAASAGPGQFFQLAVDAPHAILRRPYSLAWADPPSGRIAFIFNVVGAGSGWLASRRAGDGIDLLGPLGVGFTVEAGIRPAVCVAGGLGIAAFPALVAALVGLGRPVLVLHGARTATQLLPSARLQGAEVRQATDDGSAGRQGTVLDLLPSASLADADLFACGPTPMLCGLIDIAHRLEVRLARIQVALETPMGCGMGTCLGCVTPKPGDGYLLTCTDGPCIRADRIDWGRMVDAFHG
ncbi:MAG: dihydroorotate dehydrogenase electron transfer subunit [Candidatus Dormibacteraeota bacterium]|nr:dihydroorotate dehydrogenase electron transfer subunit [Candidatus Dormibacteraeota bacterium]